MAYEYNVGGSRGAGGAASGVASLLGGQRAAREERAEREARGWLGRTHLSGLDTGRVRQILASHGPFMTPGTKGALEQLVKDNVSPVELARQERLAAAPRVSTG